MSINTVNSGGKTSNVYEVSFIDKTGRRHLLVFPADLLPGEEMVFNRDGKWIEVQDIGGNVVSVEEYIQMRIKGQDAVIDLTQSDILNILGQK